MQVAGAAALAAFARANEASLSEGAAAFLQRRRSQWAERPIEAIVSTAQHLQGLSAVLPADQLALYNQDGRFVCRSARCTYLAENRFIHQVSAGSAFTTPRSANTSLNGISQSVQDAIGTRRSVTTAERVWPTAGYA